MARVPSSAIHSRSIRASVERLRAAVGQLLLGEQARLDPLGQLDLLLGVEQRHLADLLQVVLDRVRGGTGHRDLRGRKILVVVAEDEDLLVLAATVRRDLDDAGARRAGAVGLGVRLRGRLAGLGPVGLVGTVRSFRPVDVVRGQIVGHLGDLGDDVGLVQVLVGEGGLDVDVVGVEIVEIQIRVGIEIGLVEIHRGQAAVSVGAQLGTVLIRARTAWPRSRLNRLILDGPGPLVRRPGALPRCGVSSAHDHGHPFLRWVDATRD